ncbi:prolyl oligopeptidase family serine peptidase [candidate division KSB1 bacterium]
MFRTRKIAFMVILCAILFAYSLIFAQDAANKKPIAIEDYVLWRSVGSTSISDDGNWICYSFSRENVDDTLYVKNLNDDKIFDIPNGSRPQFSDDGKWVAYMANLPTKEADKLREAKKPVTSKVQLLDLEKGDKLTWDNASSFTFSKNSGFFAVKKIKSDPDAAHKGTDLILRNLKTGLEQHIGSVNQFTFNKPGKVLAYTVDTADKNGNGLYVIFLDNGIPTPLDYDNLEYVSLTWEEDGKALAVLKGNKKEGFREKENILVAVKGFETGTTSKIVYDPKEPHDFPKDMVISEKGSISWTEDLNKLFFAVKEQTKTPPKKKDPEPVADVDIWHWNDDRIQSVQKAQATRDQNVTYLAVIDLNTKKFIKLTDKKMKSISITRNGKWGVGTDNSKYISDWEERRADYYRVNTSTGERTLMFEEQGRTLGFSPDSKHYLYWKDGQIWDYVIDLDKKVNLTASADVSFEDVTDDHIGTVPPYGVTGWTKDGSNVILTHRYDLYMQPLDGTKAVNLTGGLGTQEEIRFRYVNLDREERFIDMTKPMMLTAYGQWTKKAGFYELNQGSLEKLIYEDKKFGRITKSKNTDKFLFTISTFKDFPDYYVSDKKFSFPKRVTDANPQQANFRWGHRILFDFENSNGVRLQGTLAIPDDYKEGQKLPMVVNFYEKYSQNLHNYYSPRYASAVNFSAFVSNGYLIMQPDIHFNGRTSHTDMLECVEAAVQKVIDMGYADPKRIGLHGHSYSGGGSAFISTRSTMFAAIAAGAAPINLISEFNEIWKGSGMNNHQYDIYGQGRYGTNPYDDFDLYVEQSPISHVRTMNTPLLYLHGTDDLTVEWLQGLEFYNGLRFNKKNVIFLSYPGAGHGLRKFENRKDFTIRITQFFEHHLKGKPAPEWITHGQTYLEKLNKLGKN